MYVFKYWCKVGTCEMLFKYDINCFCYYFVKMYDKFFLNIYFDIFNFNRYYSISRNNFYLYC